MAELVTVLMDPLVPHVGSGGASSVGGNGTGYTAQAEVAPVLALTLVCSSNLCCWRYRRVSTGGISGQLEVLILLTVVVVALVVL
jgi:tartrate dehydratase alpha subunit/fumarate hydratase class I-like protein